jgi:hypothetical protein
VYHHAAYRCNRRARENNHDRTQIERCQNSAISTHILEGHVFEMIRETMLDPGKLRGYVETGAGLDDQSTARELTRVAQKIGALDHERRALISRYAADQMTGDEYIAANRALDQRLERLMRAKAKLVTTLRPAHQEDFVDASIRQFCATARASIEQRAGVPVVNVLRGELVAGDADLPSQLHKLALDCSFFLLRVSAHASVQCGLRHTW